MTDEKEHPLHWLASYELTSEPSKKKRFFTLKEIEEFMEKEEKRRGSPDYAMAGVEKLPDEKEHPGRWPVDELNRIEDRLLPNHTVSGYAWCPDCLTLGIPFPHDRVCGNCNGKDLIKLHDEHSVTGAILELESWVKELEDHLDLSIEMREGK